jgi:hypothetical protein
MESYRGIRDFIWGIVKEFVQPRRTGEGIGSLETVRHYCPFISECTKIKTDLIEQAIEFQWRMGESYILSHKGHVPQEQRPVSLLRAHTPSPCRNVTPS